MPVDSTQLEPEDGVINHLQTASDNTKAQLR